MVGNESPADKISVQRFPPASLRPPDEVGFLFRSEQRGFAVVRCVGVPDDFWENIRSAVVDFDFPFVEAEQVVDPEGVLFPVGARLTHPHLAEDHAGFPLNEYEVTFFKMGGGAGQGVPFSDRKQENDIDRGDPVAAGCVFEHIVRLSVLIEVGLIGAAVIDPRRPTHETLREANLSVPNYFQEKSYILAFIE